jgi:hypothetical protein
MRKARGRRQETAECRPSRLARCGGAMLATIRERPEPWVLPPGFGGGTAADRRRPERTRKWRGRRGRCSGAARRSRPRRPCLSIRRCQDRNSSTDRRYRSQASSRLISPARTADTTSALRRMTQRWVLGGGRSSTVSGLPAGPMTLLGLPVRSGLIDETPSCALSCALSCPRAGSRVMVDKGRLKTAKSNS